MGSSRRSRTPGIQFVRDESCRDVSIFARVGEFEAICRAMPRMNSIILFAPSLWRWPRRAETEVTGTVFDRRRAPSHRIAPALLPRTPILPRMPARHSLPNVRIAVVHDWLDTWRGGENVLAETLAVFPHADLFALVDFLAPDDRPRVLGKHARTSFLQHLPGSVRYFRALLPLFPRAVASLDVTHYDLVVSISYAVFCLKKKNAHQFHVCYYL